MTAAQFPALVRGRFAALPAPLRGGLWMVMAATCFTGMLSTIKSVAQELHAFEIAFFRFLVTVIWMAPFLWRFLRTVEWRAHRWDLYGLRAAFGLFSSLAWFYGVPHLPLSNSIAINFTSPLFATVFAALILGEVVRLRRWAAIGVGFLGVLVVLRPGVEAFNAYAVLLLVAACTWGCQHIVLKVLSRHEPVNAIVAIHSLVLAPLTLVVAAFHWTWPTPEQYLWLAAMGTLGTLGHICLTRAFAAAEASVVLPFDFAKMPIAVAIGWIAFGEATDLWTWAGAAIIVGSTVYIARREARIARQAREAEG